MEKKIIFGILCFFTLMLSVSAADNSLYDLLNSKAMLDNQESEFVTNPSGIDFLEVSSDTNGKGLYKIGSTANDAYPILYYRGDISNNFVLYAGYCWEIIRTTSTGGIKLQYAGIPTDNTCVNTGAGLAIGKSQYNDSNAAPKYGWTYEVDGEEKNSLAKNTLDAWFEENMMDYIRELEDTPWCNDRTMTDGSNFDSRVRLEAGEPTLACPLADSYTVSSSKGNGKLTYPTAIINADEVTYAGEVLRKTQVDTFINIAYSYWSMTPYVVSKNMYPNSKGMLNMYTFTYSAGIRPMIALRNTTTIKDGDGTQSNPYQVGVKKQYQITTDSYATADKEESEAGDTVRFSVKDREGYQFVNASIQDMDGNDLGISLQENDGVYSFEMIEKDVKIVTNYRVVKAFHSVTTSNREVEITNNSVEEEQQASFAVTVPSRHQISRIVLMNAAGEELAISLSQNGDTYTFEMPDEDVVVLVEFEELPKYTVQGEDVVLEKEEYYEGDTVSFTVSEKVGEIVSRILIFNEEGEEVSTNLVESNGVYSFTMGSENLVIQVEYEDEVFINPRTSTFGLSTISHANSFPFLIPVFILCVILGSLKAIALKK